MFKIALLRPILAVLTWLAHHRNGYLYDREHASIYGKEHSPDSPYAIIAQKTLDLLQHHIALEGSVVLDAGGGTGIFVEKLLENGVEKTYLFDRSAEMLSVATMRLARFGARATVWQADIQDPIHLDDKSVDGILCIQVLHYIEDWNSISAEFFRVLKNDGCTIIVTTHPAADTVFRGYSTYFECEQRPAFMSSGGKLWPITYWHRSLEQMLAPFFSAGFMVANIVEPYLRARQAHPWWDISESLFQHFPPYVIFVLRKRQKTKR